MYAMRKGEAYTKVREYLPYPARLRSDGVSILSICFTIGSSDIIFDYETVKL